MACTCSCLMLETVPCSPVRAQDQWRPRCSPEPCVSLSVHRHTCASNCHGIRVSTAVWRHSMCQRRHRTADKFPHTHYSLQALTLANDGLAFWAAVTPAADVALAVHRLSLALQGSSPVQNGTHGSVSHMLSGSALGTNSYT